ncbi:MAG: T9SS type A sorting domain-containing protein [Caldithrix sp.]|nr:T9SS type A sorting domain-containing protein [Caldithrix sp.]
MCLKSHEGINMIRILFFIILFIWISKGFASQYWVAADGDNQAAGTVDDPWETINHALSQLSDGDTIHIYEGVYYEQLVLNNPMAFVLQSADPDHMPIIACPLEGPTISITGGDDSNPDIRIKNLQITHSDSTLQGCAIQLTDISADIRGCLINHNRNNDQQGGGIRIISNEIIAAPRIINCELSANTARGGSAIYAYGSAPQIIHNHIFNHSTSDTGRGTIFLQSCSDALIQKNTVYDNTAGRGGAVYIDAHTTPDIYGNSISSNWLFHNKAINHGGAIYLIGSAYNHTVYQNSIAQNESGGQGGGLYFEDINNAIVSSNIIVSNFAQEAGGGLYFSNSMDASIELWSNQVSGNNAVLRGGGIGIHQINRLTLGGADNLQNNIYHNYASENLNAVHAEQSIPSLNMDDNFWGFREGNAVKLQISIPGADLSELQFKHQPVPLQISLYNQQPAYWFGDGYVTLTDTLSADSVLAGLIVNTFPDTVLSNDQSVKTMEKLYDIAWGEGIWDKPNIELTFQYQKEEWENIGAPAASDMQVYYRSSDQDSWQPLSAEIDPLIREARLNLNTLPGQQFTLGIPGQAADTALSVYPSAYQSDVPKDAVVEIRFREDIDPSTINDSTVKIVSDKRGQYIYDSLYDNTRQTIYLIPQRPFISGEQITVVLTDGILNEQGLSVTQGYSWWFNVGAFRGTAGWQASAADSSYSDIKRIIAAQLTGNDQIDLAQLRGDHLYIYESTEAFHFALRDSILLEAPFSMLRAADMDNDGNNELVLVNDQRIRIIAYDTQQGFTQILDQLRDSGGTLKDFIVDDFDLDGIMDMAILQRLFLFEEVTVYYGSLREGYQLSGSTPINISGQAHKMVRFDADENGRPDIITNNGSDSDNLALLLNLDRNFNKRISTSLDLGEQQVLQAANVWHETLVRETEDLVVAGNYPLNNDNYLKVLQLQSDGQLNEYYDVTLNHTINDVVCADFDSDGLLDMAAALDNTTIQFFRGGVQSITDLGSFPMDISADRIIPADFDADGDLDILAYSTNTALDGWQFLENITRQSRTYYVDGNEIGGDGSLDAPFSTISTALNRTFDGDTIIVHPAVYQENLVIDQRITIMGSQSHGVLLRPGPSFLSTDALVRIKNDSVRIENMDLSNETPYPTAVGLNILESDSVRLKRVRLGGFEKGLYAERSSLTAKDMHVSRNVLGLEMLVSEGVLSGGDIVDNDAGGILADNSNLSLQDMFVGGNGQDGNTTTGGITLNNQSGLKLRYAEIAENYSYNLQLSNSEGDLGLCAVLDAKGGNGINVRDNSRLHIQNAMVSGNRTWGIQLDGSNAYIQNTIMGVNDSLAQNNGGAVSVNNGNAELINNILGYNNIPVMATNSEVKFHYNDLFMNHQLLHGLTDTLNTLHVAPLFVQDYYVLPGEYTVNDSGFDPNAFKLAPGSPLLDRGHPQLSSGDSSRSDIGLFGSVGRPFNFTERPEAAIDSTDSSLVLNWSPPLQSPSAFFAATAIFRDTIKAFHPDTSDMIALRPRGTYRYVDTDFQFGQDYFYRLAYVDTNGGASGYSKVLGARRDIIDYAFSQQSVTVQLGQGDILSRNFKVTNLGTLPLQLKQIDDKPAWLILQRPESPILPGGQQTWRLLISADGLQRDSTYTHRLSFVDTNTGELSKHITVTVLVSYRDLMAPRTLFTYTPTDTVKQALLKYRFTGDDSVFSSIGTPDRLLRYEYRLMRKDHQGIMTIDSNRVSQQDIQFYPLSDGLYLFQVAALDTAFNGGLAADNKIADTIMVQAGKLIIFKNRWQMITPSRALKGFTAKLNEKPPLALKKWSKGKYETVKTDSLEYGRGYWMIHNASGQVDLNDLPFLEQKQEVSVHLQTGWNQLGNPWGWHIDLQNTAIATPDAESYSFKEAVADSLISPAIYHYQTWPLQRYVRQTGVWLQPHKGYWIWSYRPAIITLNGDPYEPKTELGIEENFLARQGNQSLPETAFSVIQLKMTSGQYADDDNYFGIKDPGENLAWYTHDAFEPPPIDNQPRLYTVRQGNALSAWIKTAKTEIQNYEWDIFIQGKQPGQTAVLTWDYLQSNNGQLHFYLYHLQSGQWFRLDERLSYTIPAEHIRAQFKLYATNDDQFQPQILPTAYQLSPNYPNPFNQQTTLRIAVPFYADGKKATLTVYDLLGRKVKTLFHEPLEAGVHTMSWDGYNSNQTSVSSGIYIIRFEGFQHQSARKMILIK